MNTSMMNFADSSHEELVQYTKDLAKQKRTLDIQILDALGEISERKVYALYGYSSLGEFCREVFGLSEDCAWKRSQAARVMGRFPKIREMLIAGETHISHVALVAANITEANSELIMEKLPFCSKRDLQFFLSRLLPDGTLLDRDPTIEVTMHLKREVYEKFQRAKQLASINCASAANFESVLEQALDMFLATKDPVEKARRLEERALEKIEKRENDLSTQQKTTSLNRSGAVESIPAAVRRQVLLRDNGQCVYVGFDGKRCESKSFIQIDHIKMQCRGGSHEPENLRVMCKTHNLLSAQLNLSQ